jgi:hypothetical protein
MDALDREFPGLPEDERAALEQYGKAEKGKKSFRLKVGVIVFACCICVPAVFFISRLSRIPFDFLLLALVLLLLPLFLKSRG